MLISNLDDSCKTTSVCVTQAQVLSNCLFCECSPISFGQKCKILYVVESCWFLGWQTSRPTFR